MFKFHFKVRKYDPIYYMPYLNLFLKNEWNLDLYLLKMNRELNSQ